MLLNNSFILLFLFICIYKISFVKHSFNTNYLSIPSNQAIRGLLSIAIILHHLGQYLTNIFTIRMFAYIGYLIVGYYFFSTGYGLMKNYLTKPNYHTYFVQKRILPILKLYVLMHLIYYGTYHLFGHPLTINDILDGLIIGAPIVKYSWFILVFILFYCYFYIIMKLNQKLKLGSNFIILGIITYCILHFWLYKNNGYPYHLYISNHLLILGVFWAKYESSILTFFKKHYFIKFGIILISFLLISSSNFIFKILKLNLTINGDSMRFINGLLFVLIILLLLMKFKISNPLLLFLGDISLESYLTHGLFIVIFSEFIPIKQPFLFIILVFVLTILSSILLKRVITNKLNLIFKKPY